jgi:hypothetical protein
MDIALTGMNIADGDPLKIDAGQNSQLVAKRPLPISRVGGGFLLHCNKISEAACLHLGQASTGISPPSLRTTTSGGGENHS